MLFFKRCFALCPLRNAIAWEEEDSEEEEEEPGGGGEEEEEEYQEEQERLGVTALLNTAERNMFYSVTVQNFLLIRS